MMTIALLLLLHRFGPRGPGAIDSKLLQGVPRILGSPDDRSPPATAPTAWEWIALLAASAYLISPVLFQAWRHAGAGGMDLLFAFNLATSLLWVTLLHVVVRRPLLLHLLLIPLYVTTAIDLFLIGTFGARLSTGYVTIALTDYGDSGELLRTYTRPIVLAALLLLLVYLPCLFGMRKLRKRRSARWTAAVGGGTARRIRPGGGSRPKGRGPKRR